MTARFEGTRTARRRLSRLAVFAVVALVLSVLSSTAGAAPSDDIADAHRNAALVKAGPMTPARAELLGKTVDFGPNCDVTTGRVKLPTVYAPPCVQPVTGKNGGETSQRVHDKADTRIRRVADPAPDILSSRDHNPR